MFWQIFILLTLTVPIYGKEHNYVSCKDLKLLQLQDGDSIRLNSCSWHTAVNGFNFLFPSDMYLTLNSSWVWEDFVALFIAFSPNATDFIIRAGISINYLLLDNDPYDQTFPTRTLYIEGGETEINNCRLTNLALTVNSTLSLHEVIIHNATEKTALQILPGASIVTEQLELSNNIRNLQVEAPQFLLQDVKISQGPGDLGEVILRRDTQLTHVTMIRQIIFLITNNTLLEDWQNWQEELAEMEEVSLQEVEWGLFSQEEEVLQNMVVSTEMWLGGSMWILKNVSGENLQVRVEEVLLEEVNLTSVIARYGEIRLRKQGIYISEEAIFDQLHVLCLGEEHGILQVNNQLLVGNLTTQGCDINSLVAQGGNNVQLFVPTEPSTEEPVFPENIDTPVGDDQGDMNILYIILPSVGCLFAVVALVVIIVYIVKNKKRDVMRQKPLINNVISRDQFEIIHELGRGSQGVVYLARRDNMEVALKISENSPKALLDEYMVLISLPPHPNVIQFLGVNVNPLILEMEYINGMSLKEMRTQHSNLPYSRLAREIALGMQHLSKNGIVHRDLALRNILVSHDLTQVKITDFGLARKLNEDNEGKTHSLKGVPIPWMAPESLGKRIYSEKSDVWSFAITMWELYTGEHPHANFADDFLALGNQIVMGLYPPLIHHNIPPEQREFLVQCFSIDPEDRPTFREISNYFSEN